MTHDRTSLQTLDGDAQVLCTFDYSPAERMTLEYPGCDASVCITSVAINGHEVDSSVFDKRVIALWEANCLREVEEEAESENEYMAELAREDELERRAA